MNRVRININNIFHNNYCWFDSGKSTVLRVYASKRIIRFLYERIQLIYLSLQHNF